MTVARLLAGLAMAGVALLPLGAQAAGGEITLFNFNDTENGQTLSVKLQILVLMTLLGLLPAMLMLMTSFTRFIIVLAMLRQAMGLQQSPPNNVMIGIALALTLLVMRPVGRRFTERLRAVPERHDQPGTGPGRGEKEHGRFHARADQQECAGHQILDLAKEEAPANLEELDFTLLLPAFVLSELKTAFQIGFLLFVPFLVIDLVVASVLMAMGMMMLSPMMISLPFKLLLFVLVDGWTLLVGTLTTSIQPF